MQLIVKILVAGWIVFMVVGIVNVMFGKEVPHGVPYMKLVRHCSETRQMPFVEVPLRECIAYEQVYEVRQHVRIEGLLWNIESFKTLDTVDFLDD